MSSPWPTSSAAAMATTPPTAGKATNFLAALFKGKSAERRRGQRAPRRQRENPARRPSWPPPHPPAACEARRRDPAAGLGRRPDRSGAELQTPGCRGRPQGRREPRRKLPPTSSTPAASGTTAPHRAAGQPGAGCRPQRAPGRRRRRSAADRQRHRSLQQGARLCAGRRIAGRPRQHRRRQRADPAQRPPGAMPQLDRRTRSTPWSPRARPGAGSVITTSTRLAAAKGATISGCA